MYLYHKGLCKDVFVVSVMKNDCSTSSKANDELAIYWDDEKKQWRYQTMNCFEPPRSAHGNETTAVPNKQQTELKERVVYSLPQSHMKINLDDGEFKGCPEIDWDGCSVHTIIADLLTAVNHLREVTHGAFNPENDKFTIRIAKNLLKHLDNHDSFGFTVYDKIQNDWPLAEVVLADAEGLIRNVADMKVLCDGYEFRAIVKNENDLETSKKDGNGRT